VDEIEGYEIEGCQLSGAGRGVISRTRFRAGARASWFEIVSEM